MATHEKMTLPNMLELKYSAAWQELLTAVDPEAIELQLWFGQLVSITGEELSRKNSPVWADSEAGIVNRWQRAIEIVADTSLENPEELTESQRIEAALRTITMNIEIIEWAERGIAFNFPLRDSPESVDVKDAPLLNLCEIQSYIPTSMI